MVTRYKNKVKLQVWIEDKIYNDLISLVKSKYENLRGGLSKEVEEALLHWIRLHTQNHTSQPQINRVNPVPKAKVVFDQVKAYIRRKRGFVGQQVTYGELVEAISAIRGSDKRTVRKWMQEFLKYKLIKPIAGEVYEIL